METGLIFGGGALIFIHDSLTTAFLQYTLELPFPPSRQDQDGPTPGQSVAQALPNATGGACHPDRLPVENSLGLLAPSAVPGQYKVAVGSRQRHGGQHAR